MVRVSVCCFHFLPLQGYSTFLCSILLAVVVVVVAVPTVASIYIVAAAAAAVSAALVVSVVAVGVVVVAAFLLVSRFGLRCSAVVPSVLSVCLSSLRVALSDLLSAFSVFLFHVLLRSYEVSSFRVGTCPHNGIFLNSCTSSREFLCVSLCLSGG